MGKRQRKRLRSANRHASTGIEILGESWVPSADMRMASFVLRKLHQMGVHTIEDLLSVGRDSVRIAGGIGLKRMEWLDTRMSELGHGEAWRG